MENKINKEFEISIEQIENTKLADIREFFHQRLYDNITKKYNIHTLYDLIKKSSNGELFKIIFNLPINNEEKNEQYKETIGCVCLLMCKYFNQDPMLNRDNCIRDIKYKLILDDLSVDRLEILGITKLGQLLEMAEKKDFSNLYSQEGLGKIVSDCLVKKIKLIYDYFVAKDKSQKDENVNYQEFEITQEITSDINSQYDELQRLIAKSNQLSKEIAKVQSKLDEIKIDKKQDKNIVNMQYSEISNISIIEVKNFFSTSNFEYLVENGFLTLGELFNVNFRKLLMNFGDRPYNERLKIVATIKILRCKYLGEDPKIDNQTTYKDFEIKLGISCKTQVILHNKLGINNLEELLQIIENKDFLQLNQIESDELIAKLVVLYKFSQLNHQHTNNNDDIDNNNQLDLYQLLRELIVQNNLLNERIYLIQSKLNKSIQRVKSI